MDEATLRCDGCGYLREGLDAQARCPECGDLPPRAISRVGGVVGAASSAGEQRWLASVAGGLMLLCVCYAIALHSQLFINRGAEVLAAINAAGPKFAASAMILRQIGDPGPNGVRGMLAALGTMLAVVLITTPQHSNDVSILRRGLRVGCVVLAGALFAYLVSRGLPTQRYYYDIRYQYSAAVGIELLVNVPLYVYLAVLSRRTDRSGASARLLRATAILLGFAIAGGGVLRLLERHTASDLGKLWLGLQCGYGAFAIGTGVIMTLACLQLTWQYARATLARPMRWWRFVRSVGVVRWLSASVQATPRAWAAMLGLAILVSTTQAVTSLVLLEDNSFRDSWRLWIITFLAPRIDLPAAQSMFYRGESSELTQMFLHLFATVLLTCWQPPVWRWVSAAIVRWTTIFVVGSMLGMSLFLRDVSTQDTLFSPRLQANAIAEGFLTLLLYLYLARLAAAVAGPRPARLLAAIGVVAMAMIVWPSLPTLFPFTFSSMERSTGAMALVMVYGGFAFVVSTIAWFAFARLGWAIFESTVLKRSNRAPKSPVAETATAAL